MICINTNRFRDITIEESNSYDKNQKMDKMKIVIVSIILFTICLNINGQQINQSNNCYRGNDVLEKKQVTAQSFDLNSNKGVWSLEEAKLSEDSYSSSVS